MGSTRHRPLGGALLLPALLACASPPRGESTGSSRTGSCACCGTIVDTDSNQSCADPEVCAPYCQDGGEAGPADGSRSEAAAAEAGRADGGVKSDAAVRDARVDADAAG